MGGGGRNVTTYWFSLNNSETVKAVTLAVCSIPEHLIRNILAKFGIPYSLQSPDIRQNLDRGISDFQISGQSLKKETCHDSRTSDDIDMKPRPVTKLNKGNKTMSKKNLTMTSCWKIVTSFPISQFVANLKQFGSRIPNAYSVKLMFSLIVVFLSYKTEYRTKKSLTQLWHYCSALSKGPVFAKKRWFFTKNGDISKIKKVLVLKGIFSATAYAWALTCQIWSF